MEDIQPSPQLHPVPVLSYVTPPELDRSAMFREGPLAVMPRGGSFPLRCVYCNTPCSARLPFVLRYRPPFRIVLTETNYRALIPLCRLHLERAERLRRTAMFLACAGALTILATIALALTDVATGAPAIVPILIGGLLLAIAERVRAARVPLRLVRLTKSHLSFSRAGQAFLESLDDFSNQHGS